MHRGIIHERRDLWGMMMLFEARTKQALFNVIFNRLNNTARDST